MPHFARLMLPLAAVLLGTGFAAAEAKTAPKAAAKAPARPAAARTNWASTVSATPEGGFVLGNPNAPTKLVEYLSYTCPHCAHFAAESTKPLKAQWIRQGTLSIEYRSFVRDPFDLAAAMLARCGGASRFLANHEALFAKHEAWIEKAQAYANGSPSQSPDPLVRTADIAEKTGLLVTLAAQGTPVEASRRCLADKGALETILAMRETAAKMPEMTGTPFFLLNGKPVENIASWSGLLPLLPALPRSAN